MNYCIFTDESGKWSENEGWYIRGWVKIPAEMVSDLENEFENDDFNKDIYCHFTITKLCEFYSQKIIVREEIEKSLATIFDNLKSILKEYMEKIPTEVSDAVNRILFLFIYERWMWEDAKRLNFDSVSTFYINNPQFTKKEYREMLDIVGINAEQIKFKKGNHQGIKIADKYVSLLGKILSSNFEDNHGYNNFKRSIKRVSLVGGNLVLGIDKVFYRYDRDSEIKKMFQNYLGAENEED